MQNYNLGAFLRRRPMFTERDVVLKIGIKVEQIKPGA